MASNSRPTTHQADLTKLPRALAPLIERPQWCIWRWTQLENGGWQKPPFVATQPQRHASTKDPSTWSDYTTALAAVQAGHGDGLSYILTENDPYAAIDLDGCRHPDTCSIDIWAQLYMQRAVTSYQEITPSGTGIRIWGRAEGASLNRKFTLDIDGKSITQRVDGKTIAAELFRRTNKALTITGLKLDTVRELTNIDRVIDWAIIWGERRKVAAAEAAQLKRNGSGSGFDSSGCGYSVDQIEQTVREGAPDDANRSNMFHTIVGHYVGCGWGVEQIIEHLQQFPGGIGARYIGEERLAQEVIRSASKYGVKPSIVPAKATAPEDDPELQPDDPELEDDPELLPDDPQPVQPDPQGELELQLQAPPTQPAAQPAQPLQSDDDYDPELDDDEDIDEDADPEPQHVEPKPLPEGLAPVMSFDPSFLPTALAPWISDIAERLQCPPDYVTVPAVIALGSVIGRRVGIKPQAQTDWVEYCNTWGMIIGSPGMLKSPAMQAALGPIYHLEAEVAKDNEVAHEAHKANISNFKVRQAVKASLEKAAQKAAALGKDKPVNYDVGAEPEEPEELHYYTNDSTYEAVGKLLVGNPTGLLIVRDELVSLLRHLDREEQTVARSFYMSGWSGTQPYTFNRIIRGRLHIEAVCLSIIGNTQPTHIGSYVRRANADTAGGDGLLQRFGMLVWPDSPPEWKNVDRWLTTNIRERAWSVFTRMSELSETNLCASGAQRGPYDKTPFFRFDDAALEEFTHWREKLERRLRSHELPPAIEGHFAKYRKLVPALALINHLADGGEGSIKQSALHKAIAFSIYLESHARRVYGGADAAEVAAAKAILAHIRQDDLKDGFTARDVQRHCWSNLSDRQQVQAGLDLLVELDWLTVVKTISSGRPKITYTINLAVLRAMALSGQAPKTQQ